MRRSGCWMLILFVNRQMTAFQATSIQFQACPEQTVWHHRFGSSGLLWEGGFGAIMRGAPVADEMGIGKTFTSVAVAMLCKFVTEKVVIGLPLSIVWGNTLEEWVILLLNDCPGIVGQEQEWYLLQRLNSVPCCLLETQTPPPHGYPAHVPALELILVATMPGLGDTIKTVINESTHGTEFELVNLLHTNNINLTQENLKCCIDMPENGWNIHLVSYDTLQSRA